jgi:hypothetical protein
MTTYTCYKSIQVSGTNMNGIVYTASASASASSTLSQMDADTIATSLATSSAEIQLNYDIGLNKLIFTPGTVYSGGQQTTDYAIIPLYSDPSGLNQVGSVRFTDHLMNLENNYVLTEKGVFSILDSNQDINIVYEYSNSNSTPSVYWADGTTNVVKILYGYGTTSSDNNLFNLTGAVQIYVNPNGVRSVNFIDLPITGDETLNATYYYLYSDFSNYNDFYYTSNN